MPKISIPDDDKKKKKVCIKSWDLALLKVNPDNTQSTVHAYRGLWMA